MSSSPNNWPCDPAFKDLFAELSAPRMASALQALVRRSDADDGAPTNCRMIEALYDPGQQIRIAYAVSHKKHPARVWPDGTLFYVRYPVRQPMSRRGCTITVGKHELEVYRFPNDRRLRGLRKFSSRQGAAAVWQAWLERNEPDLTLDPRSLRRRLLRYVPEQKWIIRLDCRCPQSVSESVKRTLAVRASDETLCATVYKRTLLLRERHSKQPAAFRIPRPIALDTELGLLATRWVWGDSLLELLVENDAREIMQHVATGLLAFHETKIDDLPTISADELSMAAELCVSNLGLALPSCNSALQEVSDVLARKQPDNRSGLRRTVHSDLHMHQLRGRKDRLTLMDFERCALGDPWIDVANLATQLATLPYRSEMGVSFQQADLWRESFLEAWESLTGSAIDMPRMHYYGAMSLLTLARGMMRHLRPGWDVLAQHCVDLAHHMVVRKTMEVGT